MLIVVDSREQAPFTFEGKDCDIVTGSLTTGDYSLAGLEDKVAIERKSLADLVGCLTGSNRERFERELNRGRGLDLFAVVIEAWFTELTAKQYRATSTPTRRRNPSWPFRCGMGRLSYGREPAGRPSM